MGIFDEIIAKADPNDRAVLDKYGLRDTVEKLEQDRNAIANYANGWLGWQNGYKDEQGVEHPGNWDNEHGMTRSEYALKQELAAAQARLNAGVTAGAGAGEIAKLREEMQSKIEAVKADAYKSAQTLVNGMDTFYNVAATKLLPHHKEFGENLDAHALGQYMHQHQIPDPNVAYDQMVAPKRAELAAKRDKELEAKHAADIEAARQEGYTKRAQEAAMGPGGLLPTDQTGGIAGITAYMGKPAAFNDVEKAALEKAKLGEGSLPELGYRAYLEGRLPVQ